MGKIDEGGVMPKSFVSRTFGSKEKEKYPGRLMMQMQNRIKS